jgi:recombination protein RecR
MASRVPESLERLQEALERLPGIGPRSAARLAHHLLRTPEPEALGLADAIRAARARIRPCSGCGAPAESDPCPLCADVARDRSVLLVVESARDLLAVEGAGGYRGLYFVLGGRLSPLEGVDADQLPLRALAARAAADEVREVCLGTNPDLEGDGTALAVEAALEPLVASKGLVLTRLARGLPSGGQIEYQSAPVLADAFEGRRRVAGRGSASD